MCVDGGVVSSRQGNYFDGPSSLAVVVISLRVDRGRHVRMVMGRGIKLSEQNDKYNATWVRYVCTCGSGGGGGE